MKFFRYFIYITFHWNLKIAWHIIQLEIKGEKKYGIDTTGADELQHLEKKGIDTGHATIYMPASYDLLERVFDNLPVTRRHHFLDIGCGKGRALCIAAHHGFAKVTGIDFSKKLCTAAEMNLSKTQLQVPSLQYEIINNDAFYFEIPADVDCIFLFNPFDEVIMSGVVNNIVESLANAPRKLLVVYANPLHKELFEEEGFEEIYYSKEMKYLELSILIKN